MLITSKKGDGGETWKVLRNRFEISEIDNLFKNWINISMGQNESVVDY